MIDSVEICTDDSGLMLAFHREKKTHQETMKIANIDY